MVSPAQPASIQQLAQFGTMDESGTIKKAWENSCYNKMEFAISEDATMFEAVQQFSAYRVGALVVTNAAGMCLFEPLFLSNASVERLLLLFYLIVWNKHKHLDAHYSLLHASFSFDR